MDSMSAGYNTLFFVENPDVKYLIMKKNNDHETQMREYIRKYQPYRSTGGLGIDLSQLSEYAQSKGIKANELSEDEVSMFAQDRLTWEQIKEEHPEQWVRLEGVEWIPGNDATISSAVVTKFGEITTQDRRDAMDGKCVVIYVDTGKYFHSGLVHRNSIG